MNILKPYIIGETAYNHEGDIDYLFKMINDIAVIGLNAVKFHLLLNPNSYLQKKHPLISETRKWIFSKQEWEKILNYARKKTLDIVALCDDVDSIKFVNDKFKDIFAVEIHSTSLNDYFLLEEASRFSNKIILGIGGSTLNEIQYAVDFLVGLGKREILLMYGFQSFPTNYNNVNLLKMKKLQKLFDLPVGYADHTAYNDVNNEIVSSMASMMGVNILEKHYTPDPGKKRIDYQSAVGKKKMKKIKDMMSLFLKVYGSGSLEMTDAEKKYGNTGPMKKAIVARRDIEKGEELSLENLWFKRTEEESTVKQYCFLNLIGLKTIRDIKEDEIIDFSKVKYRFAKKSYSDLTGGLRTKE